MAMYRLPELDTNSFMTLERRQMLNDTIVEYYMVHRLLNQKDPQSGSEVDRDPALVDRFHIFNTFFYKKLLRTFKNKPDDIGELSKTWDRHVKLFSKNYLVVPVCDHLHWMLVIVCNPSKVPAEDDQVCIIGDTRPTTKLPCILVFDSLGFQYLAKISAPFRKFLEFRWAHERPNESKRSFNDRKAFPIFTARVPRQRNAYDCGLYMLAFYEKFINSPKWTQAFAMRQKDFRDEWTVDAADRRNEIKQIISRSGRSLTISSPDGMSMR